MLKLWRFTSPHGRKSVLRNLFHSYVTFPRKKLKNFRNKSGSKFSTLWTLQRCRVIFDNGHFYARSTEDEINNESCTRCRIRMSSLSHNQSVTHWYSLESIPRDRNNASSVEWPKIRSNRNSFVTPFFFSPYYLDFRHSGNFFSRTLNFFHLIPGFSCCSL